MTIIHCCFGVLVLSLTVAFIVCAYIDAIDQKLFPVILQPVNVIPVALLFYSLCKLKKTVKTDLEGQVDCLKRKLLFSLTISLLT